MCPGAPFWRSTSNKSLLTIPAAEGLRFMKMLCRLDTPKRGGILALGESDAPFTDFPHMPIYVRCVHFARPLCRCMADCVGVCTNEPSVKHHGGIYRKCYVELMTIINGQTKENVDGRWQPFAIRGSPGIGKTSFFVLLMQVWLGTVFTIASCVLAVLMFLLFTLYLQDAFKTGTSVVYHTADIKIRMNPVAQYEFPSA